MFFKIEKETFLKALQKIQGIIEKKTSIAILSNALLEVSDNNLNIIATDLDITLKANYPCTVYEPGVITVNAKKIYEIIKELPNNEISISVKENDRIEIVCDKIKYNIVGLSSSEFPSIISVNEDNFIDIKSTIFKRMIDYTYYAICNDETKYNLNGVFTKVEHAGNEKILKMVATDGHRLSISSHSVDGDFDESFNTGVILPKKGVFEIKKITEEKDTTLKFGFADNNAILKSENTTLIMRLIDGEYPDYTRVIPPTNELIVKVNKESLYHAVRRMSILSTEKFKGVMFEISNSNLKISSNNPELGDATEVLNIEYSGVNFSVRFNAQYLLDVLVACEDETVIMKFKDEFSPTIILPESEDSLLAVVMPMRL